MTGRLYIVATPIGNLADITLRALETLKRVDFIACEDTRVSRKLLSHHQINARLVSYHQHSNKKKEEFIIQRLAEGDQVVVITDAGTPGIADPGNQLVARAVERLGADLAVIPIPGPAALTTALSVAGLPTDRFYFLGFLPHKKGKQTMIKRIIASQETVVFYESTHRILKTLEMFVELMPPGAEARKIVVGRELTKQFETIYRGRVAEVIAQLRQSGAKGELVVIMEGQKK
ncbi:MAG TPA: 16S rRNA (cytidine(1402)-2'-O)-methyltransferase [bacterium]|nr:16S rRNA (cytidine(1402)-2'-O)-methyltransferase [bacterium]HPN81054.1 16S rRNA (cytidine(1402)-2'-O)-methyltransferase [bacterium]HPW39468.1 16S rRNA (cytidine(1402)-2'-O)-methyltransferase [bacterium]